MEDHVGATEPELAEDTRIGDFQIRGLLGEGAMGQVYLAEDTTLDRRVALKLLKRSVLELRGAARFLDEARATASFNHPHIVTLYAVGEYEGRPYLALEYIDGESLRACLAEGPLPVPEALGCCCAVAEAIAEAHRHGIVHADLKPENILVPADGRVRVVDFGLARLAQVALHATSGTPAYMAPERWRGEPPTGAIDVWALGIILHELITGSRPIPDAELLPIAFTASTLELSDLPATPWAQLVRDCLALDPAGRPSADELVRRLSGLLDPHALALDDAYTRPQLKLMFSAHNVGQLDDEWLAPVVERMMRQTFRDRWDRRFHIVEHGDDAMRIELAYIRESQIRIDAFGVTDEQILASASARSVTSAVRALAEVLGGKLGVGLDPASPDVHELEAMARIGATSADLFRRYRGALHAHCATALPDLSTLATTTRRIIADDPMWAHPYALLATIEGQATDLARDVLATARTAASAARDPSGMQLIGALELAACGHHEAAFHAATETFRQNDADLLAGTLLASWAMLARRTEETMAIIQHLHAGFPELSFGMDLALWLRYEGRDSDSDRVIREWTATVPENLPARVELVRVAANASRIDEARERTREVIVLHGDRDDVLPELFEACIASDQISRARAIADRMLAGSPVIRAYGRYRVAMTSVFDGRFAAAYDTVRRAIIEHRAFGMRSELTQCLELARSIAPLMADLHAQRRYTEELAAVFETMIGDVGIAAATRFELALLEHHEAAPSIDHHLASLEDGPTRDVAHRRMLRAAALAGCGSPQEAVAAGFSAVEENTASLVAFGLCACRVRELELARRSFELATRRWTSLNNNQSSPYHAILARFHLAGVLAELGERTTARATYEAFLHCWSNPDRPIPEVATARRMLEADRAGQH